MISSAVVAVEAALRAAGVEPELRTFSESVPTAAAAAAVLGCEVGAIANSLVFAQSPAQAPGQGSAGQAGLGASRPCRCWSWPAARIGSTRLAWPSGCARARSAGPAPSSSSSTPGSRSVAWPRWVIPGRCGLWSIPDLAQFGVLWAGGGDKYTMFATNFEELVAMTAGTVIPVA